MRRCDFDAVIARCFAAAEVIQKTPITESRAYRTMCFYLQNTADSRLRPDFLLAISKLKR
jgi:hypothetical protein